jgi:hypothetical protein
MRLTFFVRKPMVQEIELKKEQQGCQKGLRLELLEVIAILQLLRVLKHLRQPPG